MASLAAALLTLPGCVVGPDATTPRPPNTAGLPPFPLGCISQPSACGYPDASTTGVEPSAALRRVPQDLTAGPGWTWDRRGWLTVDTDGAIVEGLIVDGSINVEADDVTVRNNRVLAVGNTWGIGLLHTAGTTVAGNDVGVAGSRRLETGVKDVYGDSTGMRVQRNDIANTATGVQLGTGVVEGNFIHDMGLESGDHVNGITSNGAIGVLVIRNNTVLNQLEQTDAVGLFQDFGVEANRTVTGNLLAGGSYTVYGGAGARGPSHNIRITDNRFANAFFERGGSAGAVAYFDVGGSGNVWSDNIWDHDGSTVPPPS